MKQIRQLRQVLEEPVPGMDAVRIGAVQIAVHVQQRLVVQESCPDLRAERLEPLHGEMVEGRDEHLLLHLAAGHRIDHPLLQHKLSILRDERTGVKEFREIVSEIATLECYEATRDLPLEDVEIKTPVATGTFKCLTGKKLAIVPILRAGLGMVDGILTLIPSAKVGHIGLYRDPETLAPVEYYCKMPHDIAERDVIVLDPMLATGGSAVAAIQFLKNYECRSIKLMNILAAPEGIQAVRTAHPDVDIYVAAVDEKLNDHGYIVPGLGDAGDRIFGTK